MNDDIFRGIEESGAELLADSARRMLCRLIQPEQYVGEVYSISYSTALVQIHDYYRKNVGGIPSLSFLIATRLNSEPENTDRVEFQAEDSSVILLRVLDAANLPSDAEAERIRVQSAQQVTGELDKHWDDQTAMDSQTAHFLSFAGVKCRVIGTFYLDTYRGENPRPTNLVLRFGSDLSNFYPNRGLKVYKPNGLALKLIVNYQDPDRVPELVSSTRVEIGEIRYASTNRSFQGTPNVRVSISPADMLGQKTAVFGMTRVGKSNTVKIVAKAVFDLRFDSRGPQRIGQLIFDPNGEYANENTQDANSQKNPSALKNVWQREDKKGQIADVVTYGVRLHTNDPRRKQMLINFYADDMLQTGKQLIDTALESQLTSLALYVQNFLLVRLDAPDPKYYEEKELMGALVRHKRRVLAYRTLLNKAGFALPSNMKRPLTSSLFSKDIVDAMGGLQPSNRTKDQEREQAIKTAASILSNSSISWDALASAFEGIWYFLSTDAFTAFDQTYRQGSSSGESWADSDLRRLLEMFAFPKTTNLLGLVKDQHAVNSSGDYADAIYDDLRAGRLVIVDQSGEEYSINESAATRIMQRIFTRNQDLFRKAEKPPEILVYVEEAHNLLPQGSDQNLKNIWVRTAKEGGKYHIGMVYATQEVSSIQSNILKNTANWLIGHLNNTDESRVLTKFYDFDDFGESIIRAQDRGFLRVKTLSNLFTIPVQVLKFEV